MTPRRIIPLFLLGLLAAPQAWARKEIANKELEAATGSRVEIAAVFDPPPPSGYQVMRVLARNGTENPSVWNLSFQMGRGSHQHASEFGFAVPGGTTETRLLLVPLAASYGGYGYNYHCRIAFSAGGLGSHDFADYGQQVGDLPAIAVGKTLADNAMSRLESEVENRRKRSSSFGGPNTFGSRFDSADLPEDWRALSGFDVVMLTHTEWAALKPGARLAVLQWARLGGRLHLHLTPKATVAELGLPPDLAPGAGALSLGSSEAPASLGSLRLISWDGKNLDAKNTVDRYWNLRRHTTVLAEQHTQLNGDRPAWALLLALGERTFASWQVLIFLIVFGVLVGPVNLFVLAPTNRRHRLFVTTPLLSLGASAVMMVILLLQDGVGGIGRRLMVIDMEPAEATAYVTQEQASRTGLLLSAGFAVPPGTVVEPLALPDKPWVKLKNRASSQSAQLRQEGDEFAGNFFQSRAEQGQLIRSVLPTRARIELKTGQAPEAPPQLISALGFTVSELYYIDGQNRVWKGSGAFATGQPMPLSSAEMAEFRKWWRDARQQAGLRTRERLEEVGDHPRNRFFAKAAAAPGFTVDTLKSIRWSDDVVLVFGTVPTP